jgi:hypothetical protein
MVAQAPRAPKGENGWIEEARPKEGRRQAARRGWGEAPGAGLREKGAGHRVEHRGEPRAMAWDLGAQAKLQARGGRDREVGGGFSWKGGEERWKV